MIYIFDKDENLLEIIKDYKEFKHIKKLNSDRSLSFEIEKNNNIKKYNKVGFFDKDMKFQLFFIDDITSFKDNKIEKISVDCLADFYNLGNTIIDDKRATTIRDAVTKALEGSNYKVGIIESFEDRNINFYHVSRIKALNEIINVFKCEIDIRVEIDESTGRIGNKFIDFKHRLGQDTAIRFTYDTALESIEKDTLEGHFNVLWGWGKSLETENGGYSRKLDFADINGGKKYVEDVASIKKYGRLEGIFEDGKIEDKAILLKATKERLEDVKNPKMSYKASIKDISKLAGYEHFKVNLGDTICILDEEINDIVEARIIGIEESKEDEKSESDIKLTLGNFLLGLTNDSLEDILGDLNDKVDNIKPDIPTLDPDKIFPDTLPKIPIVEAQGLFSSVILSWTYENKNYYTYELFASKIKDFMPDNSNRIFEGKASSFLHEVKPSETWYYRCRAKNTYDNVTDYSTQVEATTKKIEDGTEWFEELAITHALIGSVDADKITVGKLKAQFLELYNLLLTDGNGKETLRIDDFGRVYMDVTNLKINSESIFTQSEALDKINEAIKNYKKEVDKEFIETQSSIDDLKNLNDDIFKDEIVTVAEKEALKKQKTILEKEHKDVVVQANALLNTTELSATIEKNNLNTSKLALETSYLNIVQEIDKIIDSKTTSVEGLNAALKNYTDTLKILREQIQICIDFIAQTKADKVDKKYDTRCASIELTASDITQKVSEISKGCNLNDISRWILETPSVVTDVNHPIYQSSGIPNPPLGGAFNGIRLSSSGEYKISDNSISTNGVSWAIISAYMMYVKTENKEVKQKCLDTINAIATFMTNNISIGQFNSTNFKFFDISYKYDKTTGVWIRSNYKEIYLSSIWLSVNALCKAYKLTQNEKYGDCAKDIIDSLYNTHAYINRKVDSGDLPEFLRWGSYEYLVCDNITTNNRFSGSTRQYANQMGFYIYQGVNEFIGVFGDEERTTSKGDRYRPSNIKNGFSTYLKTAYDRGITAQPLGLPYGYYHRITLEDGSTDYVLENWDFIDNKWGDVWFVGDVVLYIIVGYAALGHRDIAKKYAENYFKTRVPVSSDEWKDRFNAYELVFFDRLDFYSGSHLADDNSISITYTSLYYELLEILGIQDNLDVCSYTLHKRQIKSDNKIIDGGYNWNIAKDNASLELKSFGEIINSQFYNTSNPSEISIVNEKYSEIEQTASSITQKVESVEKKTTTLENGITTVEETIKKVEEKITDDAIINTVKETVTTAKNEAINSANNSTDGKLNNYVTTTKFTEFKQTSENFQMSIKRSGGQNLIKNSAFDSDDTRLWNAWGSPTLLVVPDNSIGFRNSLKMTISQQSQGITQRIEKLVVGQEYTISCLGYSQGGLCGIMVSNKGQWGGTIFQWAQNVWGEMSFTFTAREPETDIYFGTINESCRPGIFWITGTQITKGNIVLPWSSHGNEIYGVDYKADETGFKGTYENGTYTSMGKDGFAWFDKNNMSHPYHSLIKTGIFNLTHYGDGNWTRVRVELPNYFKGKYFEVQCAIAGFETGSLGISILTAQVESYNIAEAWFVIKVYATNANSEYFNNINITWMTVA